MVFAGTRRRSAHGRAGFVLTFSLALPQIICRASPDPPRDSRILQQEYARASRTVHLFFRSRSISEDKNENCCGTGYGVAGRMRRGMGIWGDSGWSVEMMMGLPSRDGSGGMFFSSQR